MRYGNCTSNRGDETNDAVDLATYLSELRRVVASQSECAMGRWRAAQSLGNLKDSESLNLLSEALKDHNSVVRWEAATSLGKIGSPTSICSLICALMDESYQVRKRASQALIKISGVPSSELKNLNLLIKLLASGDERVVLALLEIGSPAYTALQSSLKDDLFFVRRDATLALANFIRNAIKSRPEGEDVLSWLECQNMGPKNISRVYNFRTFSQDRLIKRVEYCKFDEISEKILDQRILKLSPYENQRSSIKSRGKESNWIFPETSKLNESISKISHWDALKLGDLVQESYQIEQRGRTLVAFGEERCLAIKLCLKKGDEAKLLKEALIQDGLQKTRFEIGLKSRLPKPLALGPKSSEHKGYLFRLLDLPADEKAKLNLSADPCAICYTVDESYFTYLNDPLLDVEDVARGLTLCAQDLAKLSRKGLIHDSLIPLFHNREQLGVRADGGVYRWFSMIPGRLDRWRESCRYPNLRASGIADFEHFSLVYQASAGQMRHQLGDHLLSMSLTLGSYFRNKGQFDLEDMSTALERFFEAYYTAFTSRKSPLDECIDWDHLACRMIEEMDGDKYMTAIIRGGGPDGKDLMVKSGPHLGHFSGFFPLPELIKAIHLTTLFAVMEIESS